MTTKRDDAGRLPPEGEVVTVQVAPPGTPSDPEDNVVSGGMVAAARRARVTLSGKPADSSLPENSGAPQAIDPATGQHKDYWVLSEEERKKGFVRPVRNSYKHVGIKGPAHPLRDLTVEQLERYGYLNYVKFEQYAEEGSITGRFWTQTQLDKVGKGCGTVTRMSVPLSETYARQPDFYGATFCAGCRSHFPVGSDGEFVWEGTDERVGT